MNRSAWLLLPLLGACRPSPEPVADISPPEALPPGIRVETDDGELTVRYTLAAPATELRFTHTGSVRRDGWTVSTPGVELHDDRFAASTPVTEIEVRIAADVREYDRVYPTLTRVGDGLVLYGPALGVENLAVAPQIDPGRGGVIVPEGDPRDGYVFAGAEAAVSDVGGVRVVGASSVAPELAQAIGREVDVSLAFYRRALSAEIDQPTIFVTDAMGGPMSFHGDVTDNGVVFLRFAETAGSGALDQLGGFVRHEAFHLWNGGTKPESPPWLHEGGAEYAAIVASAQAGVLSDEAAIERVSYYLSRCRSALGDAPFADVPAKGSAPYSCGVAVQWVADLEARSHPSAARHVFWIWNRLLGNAQPRLYGEAEFREHTGSIVADFLDAPDRWSSLRTQLEPMGVTVSEAPTDDESREGLLTHIMAGACDHRIGWWSEDMFVRLDTAGVCPSLPSEPEVTTIEGHPIFGEAGAAFEAAVKRCAARQSIRATVRSGEEFEVVCLAPPQPPTAFHVVKAPPLRVPSLSRG